jgi:hypothetical protein
VALHTAQKSLVEHDAIDSSRSVGLESDRDVSATPAPKVVNKTQIHVFAVSNDPPAVFVSTALSLEVLLYVGCTKENVSRGYMARILFLTHV